MMRWLIALMLLMTAPAYAQDKPAPKPTPYTEVQRAVTSQPQWLNTSRALTPEDLRGRIVLLDFWTLGCINCMDIIPDLKALEHEFGDKLTVIGVHSAKFANEKDTENIRNAMLRYGLTHPVVNDSDFVIWNKFGVRAWPTLVLINPAGVVNSVYAGEGNRAALEADIKTMLDKFSGKIVTAPLPIALESAKLVDSTLRFPGKVTAGTWNAAPALFVADSGHNRIVVTDMTGTLLQAIGGSAEGLKDGSFAEAQFFKPQGMAYAEDKLYVADLGNHALRLVDLKKQTVTTLAGTGVQGKALDAVGEKDAAKTPLASPWDVAFYPDDKHLVIAMAGAQQLWSYDIAVGTVSLLAGNGQESIDDGQYPFNSLSQPSGLFAAGDKLYFTDAESSSLRVLDKAGNVTTLIGKGLFDFGYIEGGKAEARLQHCLGLTGDADNLYIADTYNHSIRRYDLKTGTLHNYAGHDARGKTDGALATAEFNEPGGIVRVEGTLYVADTNNHLLRAIDTKAGTVATLGAPAAAPAAPAPPAPAAASGPGPNLAALSFSVAAESSIEVSLDLKPGWHINDQAPSELSLSRGDALLMGFSRDMLKDKHITLPKLKKGGSYHLKGTIYYCEEAANSLCMIKSFDVTLALKGKGTTIALPVY